VRIGDPILPRTDFVPLATGKTYLAKAFDDHVEVAVMITALQTLAGQAHPNSIYAAATVMEKVGNRGAATSVEAIDPDVAIVLEGDLAGDVPDMAPDEYPTRLGHGPTIFFYDGMLIPNLKLRDLLVDTSSEIGVPLQISGARSADNDGSYIHLHRTGVPTVVLGVAARHIHSHSSILHRQDFDQAVNLLVAVLMRLDEGRVRDLTA
jgi:endoglucanase